MDKFFVLISNWLGPDRSEVKVESFVDTKSIWTFVKIVSFRTKNGNTQILAFLLNVKSSSAKIRVPDPLLVFNPIKE